jgi:hypothetical protein
MSGYDASSWGTQRTAADRLEAFFGGQQLPAVTRLYSTVVDKLGGRAVSVLVRALPNLVDMELDGWDWTPRRRTALRALLSAAPRLERLTATLLKVDDHLTAQSLGALTWLRSLSLYAVTTAEHWATLPLAGLTALNVRRLPDGALLHRLDSLLDSSGLDIGWNQLQLLAQAAPSLQEVHIGSEAWEEQAWDRGVPSVFPSATHVACRHANSEVARPPFSDVFPALQYLSIYRVVAGDYHYLTGLPKLESLFIAGDYRYPRKVDWKALATLTALTALDLNTKAINVACLARLTNMRLLDLSGGPFSDVGALLECTTGMRQLHTLFVDSAHDTDDTRAPEPQPVKAKALAAFARHSKSLTNLRLWGAIAVTAAQVELLCGLPGLRRLTVQCERGDVEEAQRVAAGAWPRGPLVAVRAWRTFAEDYECYDDQTYPDVWSREVRDPY